MKFLLIAALVLTATYVVESQRAQEDHLRQLEHQQLQLVIQIARDLITRAEAELHRHNTGGRSHLTQGLTAEIQAIRHFEQELTALEQRRTQNAETLIGIAVIESQIMVHEVRILELIVELETHERSQTVIHTVSKRQAQQQTNRTVHQVIALARELITVAERELHRHNTAGRQHLTGALEAEIAVIKRLEQELTALEERHRTQNSTQILELEIHEMQLLVHETRLMELIAELELAERNQHVVGKRQANQQQQAGQVERQQLQLVLAIARDLITRAEAELHRHNAANRSHLTQGLEAEIQAIRRTEQELTALEAHSRVSIIQLAEIEVYETLILVHEQRLAQLLIELQAHERGTHTLGKRQAQQHNSTRTANQVLAIARELITRAESELRRHHEAGRQSVTHTLEAEIAFVKNLEKELTALEQHRELTPVQAIELEIHAMQLLVHETRLMELIVELERQHGF